MSNSIALSHIRNITVSGRIASGATTLAKQLAEHLGWNFLEGSAYNDAFFAKLGISEVQVGKRPDTLDKHFDQKVKLLLQKEQQYVIQAHLAGFNAQGVPGVFKILTVCEDEAGNDKTEIRIDRLMNRKGISVEQAKHEVKEREAGNLEKWRRMYTENDKNWIYWDRKYYDFVINTYALNKETSIQKVLKTIHARPLASEQ